VKALFWLEALVVAHPNISFAVFVFVTWGLGWKYLSARDAYIRETIRQALQDEDFRTQWEDALAELRDVEAAHHDERHERLRAFETEFTDNLRAALRDIVVSVRETGIPLQVTVTNRQSADVLREALGGSVQVRVSRRILPLEIPVVAPAQPSTVPTQWDRLLADDIEAPCPTTPTSEILSPRPPLKRPRKKT